MKPRDGFWRVAGIPLIILLVLSCFCVSVGINTLGWFGDLVTAPLRWFSPRGEAGQDLYAVLERQDEASFQLGEICTFSAASGTIISSASENPARELASDEVIALVQSELHSLAFHARDGELTLAPSTVVQYQLLSGRSVSLSAAGQSSGPDAARTTSLEGVVQGSTLAGTYTHSEQISTVTGGQGQEESLQYQASFSCPLVWLAP